MILADIGAATRSALGFWRSATPRTGGALALYVVAAITVAVGPALSWPPLGLMAVSVVEAALSVMAYGGLYRLALAEGHADDPEFRVGPWGLQWRITEWRIAGAMLLTLFFAFLIAMAILFVALLASIVVYVSEGAKPMTSPTGFLHSNGGLTLLLVGLVGVLVLVWALLRLALAMPATVDRKLVQVFSTWSLTGGRVLDILVASLAVTAPVVVLSIAAAFTAQAGVSGVAMALRIVGAVLTGLTSLPLVAGVYAWFYRRAAALEPVDAPSHN